MSWYPRLEPGNSIIGRWTFLAEPVANQAQVTPAGTPICFSPGLLKKLKSRQGVEQGYWQEGLWVAFSCSFPTMPHNWGSSPGTRHFIAGRAQPAALYPPHWVWPCLVMEPFPMAWMGLGGSGEDEEFEEETAAA